MDIIKVIKSNRFKKIGHELVWVGIGQALVAIGTLVGIRLLTDALSASVYGELALGMTFTMLVSKTIFGPISGAAIRYFSPAKEKGELTSFLLALRRLMVKGTTVISLGIVIVSVFFILTRSFHWLWLFIITGVFAVLFGFNAILDGVQNAARQRSVVAWHQAFSTWGRYLIAFGVIFWIGPSSVAAMAGYLVAILLTLISQVLIFRRTLLPKNASLFSVSIAGSYWESQMYKYAWPFATWGIFTWMQFASDRWALQFFRGTQDVGLYTVLYQLGYYPITILSALFLNLIIPVFFQRAGDGSDVSRIKNVHALNWRVTKMSLLLTFGLTLLSALFHQLVFGLLAAADYHSVSWLLPGMVLSGGLFASGQFLAVDMMSKTQTHNLIMPKIATATMGAILNICGAIWFGIPGVVAASVIFSISHFVWILTLVKR